MTRPTADDFAGALDAASRARRAEGADWQRAIDGDDPPFTGLTNADRSVSPCWAPFAAVVWVIVLVLWIGLKG